ncbi:MAG: hypothetical protein AAFY20_09390 [Cyanobacteria bacterium J06639_14]
MKWTVISGEPAPGIVRVLKDGQEMPGVLRVEIANLETGMIPELTITLLAPDLSIVRADEEEVVPPVVESVSPRKSRTTTAANTGNGNDAATGAKTNGK